MTQDMPAELAPVLALLNSLDVEEGTDEWRAGPAALGRWLVSAKLAEPGIRVSRAEYETAVRMRTGLRRLALTNNGEPADEAAKLDLCRLLKEFPLVVSPEVPGFHGTHSGGVGAALDKVVAGYGFALVTGVWQRMRQCPAGDCSWVFWDSSARGARRWCTMGVCGNRAKARAFAARRRSVD